MPMYMCPSDACSYQIRPGDTLWLIAQRFQTTVQAITLANPSVSANNLRVGQIICIPQCRVNQAPTPSFPPMHPNNNMEMTLRDELRLLWSQHVYWTRMDVISAIFDLPDAEAVTNRLLRNPKDFAAVFRQYYGDAVTSQFDKLLTEHLTIATELLKALIANSSTSDIERRWYQNADQIAEFLGRINPNWSVHEWQEMMYDHLSMLKSEMLAILDQQYTEGVNIFDNIEQQALLMADMMADGIMRQFPQDFGMGMY